VGTVHKIKAAICDKTAAALKTLDRDDIYFQNLPFITTRWVAVKKNKT
jgi:hypothetical protein